jgi:hypothetical protein
LLSTFKNKNKAFSAAIRQVSDWRFQRATLLQEKNLYKIYILSAERVNPDCHNPILQSVGQQQCLLYDVVIFLEIFKILNYFLVDVTPKVIIKKEGTTTNDSH